MRHILLVWTVSVASLTSLYAFAPARANAQTPQDGRRFDYFDFNQMWSRGKAAGSGRVLFTHPPMRIEDIGRIIPLGMMVGGHVMPIDHQYYFPKRMNLKYDVFAPADGQIVMIGHRVQLTGSAERQREYDDYALHIEHTGTMYTYYDLLTELDAAVLNQLDEAVRTRMEKKQGGPPVHVRIRVKGGQVLGKVIGRSLDISVIDSQTRLQGFLSPGLYGHYSWRIHVVDPFECFEEGLRDQLLKLNPRKAHPRGGKIDYDIDGRAVGNWFKKGTGGYAGNKDRRGYWMGHLALVYHHIDPSLVVVSIGDFGGQPRQFVVKGNGPDPAKVSAKDEVVKYELLYSPLNGSGERIELPERMRGPQGVLLVQVREGRQLKAEAFPNTNADLVQGFTEAAAAYER